jgi:hypothetical protein
MLDTEEKAGSQKKLQPGMIAIILRLLRLVYGPAGGKIIILGTNDSR